MMRYTSIFVLLLLGNISVVYSAGYVSDACSNLCSNDGNLVFPLSSAVETPGGAGKLKATILAYGTGTAGDIAAKVKYGQDINCWNISELTSLDYAFYNNNNFNSGLDCWDTSRITSMDYMFKRANAFNQDINDWDISNVKDFISIFSYTEAFNQDINGWDTSNVKDFKFIFFDAEAFNQDIGDWDTSNAVDMEKMFSNANVFNQDINEWDTSLVTQMESMFERATDFNQDISGWDTSNVKDFRYMFSNANVFNQDIGMWDVSSVTATTDMFRYATAFNQNLCDWNLLSATESSVEMFDQSGCEFNKLDIGNAVCQSCSPTSSLASVVDINVVLAVGEGGEGRPYGTVGSTIVPLTIVTFFEANPLQFDKGINEAITIEVYANVDDNENDCTKGTLLEDVGNDFVITTESKQYNDYNTKFGDITGRDYPVTSNGVVGSASVTITNFQYVPTNENKKIWFLGRGDKDGEIELCVVTSIKIDYDNDGEIEYYVSHMDSKRIISIDLVANIGDQVVDITESKATDSKTDLVVEIAVDTFVCNNKNEKVKDNRSYTIGQNFRICVGPTTEGVAAGYKVENFIELTCGDRSLIITEDNNKIDDASSSSTNNIKIDSLTSIDFGYKNDKLAVLSVLTANDTFDGKASVTCSGKVSLSYTTPGSNNRFLAPSSIEVVTSGGGAAAAGEESLEGVFKMNIKMNIPNIESSTPPLTSVAMIAFGSILSFVVSLLM